MTLGEMKRKVLAMIEEISPNSAQLTDDPDIAAKQNYVINQVMYELARIKKIPVYVELEVTEGDTITYADIGLACGKEVYQVSLFGGVLCAPKANNTVFKVLESGTAEIDCFVYPERITAETDDEYEFELSQDVLEVMPYGVAGDLLKSDVSAEYGTVYATRYESMLQRLDPRYGVTSVYIEGGVSI